MISKSFNVHLTLEYYLARCFIAPRCEKLSQSIIPAESALLTNAKDVVLDHLEKHAKQAVYTSEVSRYCSFPTSSAFALFLSSLPRL